MFGVAAPVDHPSINRELTLARLDPSSPCEVSSVWVFEGVGRFDAVEGSLEPVEGWLLAFDGVVRV